MAINSMALRRGKRKNMRPQSMASVEINKSSIVNEKSMKITDISGQMGKESPIGMPACNRVKP